jgi:alpha-tubulin suppressor-like RCC1 family protein
VNTSGSSACGIKSNGTLFCWGYNGYGQLGLGDTTTRYLPTQVGTGNYWTAVSSGSYAACALTNTQIRLCWGNNLYDQLGLGDSVDRYVPTNLPGDQGWTQVTAGFLHACGIALFTNYLYCWGANDHGGLGLGTGVGFTNVPTQVV